MREIFLKAENLLKIYGPTTAVNHLNISVYKGEVLALVGGNGAGKSTLTKILSGVVKSDGGTIQIEGKVLDLAHYNQTGARKSGIRVVHQELSLCKNLSVYENFYVEQHQAFAHNLTWRKQARRMAEDALNTVFPNHGINVNANLASLSIAQQQMVEIARATCDPSVKLMILDEPTSSLPAEQTNQLQKYIKKSSKEKGIAYIYISHRLKEIMYLADHVYIMQNGSEKYQCAIHETDVSDIVARMGDSAVEAKAESTFFTPVLNKTVSVEFHEYSSKVLKNISKSLCGGEIVGITGLEGNGQLELLQAIFTASSNKKAGLSVNGTVAYIAGDRKKEGIFPLWSITDNTMISKFSRGKLFSPISTKSSDEIVSKWNSQLKTKCASFDDLIISLSGGNQQKVLIARALALNADIILLDDPTRGVDIATKLELYDVFRKEAKEGKLVIWRTSDDAELEYCSRLIVMNSGRLAGEFQHSDFDHEAMLKIAFDNSGVKKPEKLAAKSQKATAPKLYAFSLIAMLALYLICGFLSPAIFSKFGVELLAVGFAPFIFAALGQTFMIGLGHIDLSIGAFMGLINVICATVLDTNTFLGIIFLALLILAYSLMGIIVYWRRIPPIIVTLGMSFVWTGIAYMIQDVPGGHVPNWMVQLFNFSNPLLQGILLWLLFFIILAVFIYQTKYGTVIRGFGNNEMAMENSGWSKLKAYWVIYFIAGMFAAMGGIAQSSITYASDINASATYTMLTVAAVIVGGGYFSGGVVTHIGTVFGGIALTMVSVLLGLLRVSTDFTATIQGLVLIIILSMRLFRKERVQ